MNIFRKYTSRLLDFSLKGKVFVQVINPFLQKLVVLYLKSLLDTIQDFEAFFCSALKMESSELRKA